MAIHWIEYEAHKRGVHIHHELCGHGGERFINGNPVHGFEPITQTVFQFHGCLWHGCPKHTKTKNKKKYAKTKDIEKKLQAAGYNLVVMWQCNTAKKCQNIVIPTFQTKPYPHAIVFDFEAYLDKTKAPHLCFYRRYNG